MERDANPRVTSIYNPISTHTLTWSVTTRFTALALYYTNFNSHAHVERDDNGGVVWYTIYNFNSHAHVERDM